jgi:hypothetical protein
MRLGWTRNLTAGLAVLVTLLALPSPAGAASVRRFDCAQTDVVRAQYLQKVQLGIDTTDTPRNARVKSIATGATLIAVAHPRLMRNYDGGYWKTNYGLDAYRLGWRAGIRYILLVPPGTGAAPFAIQVHEYFSAGGWWQNNYNCTLR